MSSDNAPSLTAPSTAPKRSSLSAILFWARDLFLSVIIAIVVILFIYQPVKVEGTSMMPTLTEGERIFINKITYTLGSGRIDRGDTVVFWYPLDPSKSYIKRVIGVPGDAIEIYRGQVFVHGKDFSEPYVPDEYRDRYTMQKTVVPADKYFVMGDHRSSSNDSRAWGMVDRKNIYGKAVFVYWPFDKMGAVR